jgi:broad specificity phosphatase PhoE
MSVSMDRAHLELLLVRHGSVREGEHRLWGRTPVGLSDSGRQQAAMLSHELKDVSFEALYTSPRDRALETAAAIVAPHGFDAVIDHAFDELDFGDWTGLTFSALERDCRWRQFNEARASAAIPGGEAISAFTARVRRGVTSLARRHARGTVGIVTHAEVIRSMLLDVLGWPVSDWARLPIETGSITIVTCSKHGSRVSAISTRHILT